MQLRRTECVLFSAADDRGPRGFGTGECGLAGGAANGFAHRSPRAACAGGGGGAGGGTESTPAQAPEETQPTEQEAPFQEQFKKDAVRELEGLLDEMTPSEDENEAVRQAASLMNWGVGTTLGEDEIASTTKDWLAAQGADRQKQAQAQLKKVDAAYKKLLGSEGEDLLNRAGCRAMAAYPWSDGEPLETMEAVLNSVQKGAR